MNWRLLVGCCFVLGCLPSWSAGYDERADVEAFVAALVSEHGFHAETVAAVLRTATHKEEIIELITRPAESLSWQKYRGIFIVPKRIQGGIEFLERQSQVLARAEQRFGVAPEIITAVIGVETYYGEMMGTFAVLDALATLGFDYKPRGEFFRGQLQEFFLLACEERILPFDAPDACKRSTDGVSVPAGTAIQTLKGSYAGAMGFGQFIPSSYRHFAIDFNGDGRRDIWQDVEDAVGSVGSYFAAHDWRGDELVIANVEVDADVASRYANKQLKPSRTVAEWKTLGVRTAVSDEQLKASLFMFETAAGPEYRLGFHDFYVITRYNHSRLYALAIWELANAIKGTDD